MKKRIVIVMMAAAMACSMSATAYAEDAETTTEAASEETTEAEDSAASTDVDFGVEPVFEPNKEYDKWTAIDYTIEDIGAEMVVTVSAMDDGSKYEILCNFYGDDQKAVVEYDGKEYNVVEDKTGFMKTDSPKIIEAAIENDKWASLKSTEVDFGVEPVFEPNKEYDKWTAIDYTIEDIGAEMVVTVSAMEDGSKYEILCNFYGDDQKAVVEYDGKEYNVVEDKTGFMKTDSPKIIEAAIENDIWASLDEETDADAADTASADVDFGVESVFDPNPDYDKYTAIDYTIEDIGAEMVVTVSAMEDGSKYEILCNFYGDDQKAVVEYDGKEYNVVEDKTGFMKTDSPKIIEAAIENDIWAPIA